ncbi:MAG: hypothetical protein ABIQ66_10815 [Novosphingobium sp.]
MDTPPPFLTREAPALSREERLAAKLRENLKRRKVQSRALVQDDPAALPKPPPAS